MAIRTYGLLYYDDSSEKWAIHFVGKQNWFYKGEVEMEYSGLIVRGVSPDRINRVQHLIPGYNFQKGGDK